jgi:hypothetical protein
MVERWAEEAFLVTATPKALKEAMEKQINTLYKIITLWIFISSKARGVSSSFP